MARPRSVDIVTEWTEVQFDLYQLEKRVLEGWAQGWSQEKQSEAVAWLLYGRKEAARRKRRLRKIHRERVSREKRSARSAR